MDGKGNAIPLLFKTGSGYCGIINKYSQVSIPTSVCTELLHNVEDRGIILRTKTREDISDKQFGFLLANTVDMSKHPDYDSAQVPGFSMHLGCCGVNVFIRKAKEVGYVVGMRVCDVVLWDDGTYTEVLKGERAQAWRHNIHSLPSWDGCHSLFH
jgi:hypothetical protein